MIKINPFATSKILTKSNIFMLKYGKAFDLRPIRGGLFSEGLFCVIFFFLKLFCIESERNSKTVKMFRKFAIFKSYPDTVGVKTELRCVFELNSYFPAKIFSR